MNRTRVAVALAGLIGLASSVYAQSPAAPTFSKDVAPILYQNCTNCHRAGEIGPMPLVSFSDARPWAKAIATRVTDGTMPPWHADPAHGQFAQRSPPERQGSRHHREVGRHGRAGRQPRRSAGRCRRSPKAGRSGTPDTIWSMQEDYPIPASGTIEYKNFEVPTNLTEDRWAQAIEVRPGNRSVVHHVIVYLIDPNAAKVPPPFTPAAQHAPSGGSAEDRARRRAERSADEASARPAGWRATRRDSRCASTSRAPRCACRPARR